MALTFYTNPNSRGRIVRWMLEEVGCNYDTVVLDYERSSEAVTAQVISLEGGIDRSRLSTSQRVNGTAR